MRHAVNDGTADFNSIFLHEIPLLFRRGQIKLAAALVQVSPPDEFGYCSLGTSVDSARAACCHADVIIAVANKHVPRTFGDAVIHSSHFDVLVQHDTPLHQRTIAEGGEIDAKIGKIIADNLVDNGATLQMGK